MRERFIVVGPPGTGKTYAWATIARALPKSKFYVIDPDDGVRRVLYEVDDDGNRIFPDLSNIEYYFTPTWYTDGVNKVPTIHKLDDEVMKCFHGGVADSWRTIKPKLRDGDWMVVEHLGNIWGRVQDGYANEVFLKDIGQYFLEARKQMKEGSKKLEALQGWVDWQIINKLHNDDFIIPVCFENPAHVFMTTAFTMSDPKSKEDTNIKAFYGETSIRLEGQRHNPFRAQTILMFKRTGKKDAKFLMNTFLKDRGRQWIEEYEWSDFYFEYLVKIAGWA